MNNPPAFPQPKLVQHATHFENDDGMTLRDYFAAKFIHPAFVDGTFLFEEEDYHQLAKICYAMADAMMKAREQ